VAAWRFHHGPAFTAIHHCGAQLPKAGHFGFTVISFYIQVDTAFVVNRLEQYLDITVVAFQSNILAVNLPGYLFWLESKCRGPEAGLAVQVVGFAVNDHGAESALVHF
jgi:hypothetical protein